MIHVVVQLDGSERWNDTVLAPGTWGRFRQNLGRPTMKIEMLEDVKQAPYGLMLQGEVRVVDDQFGEFACANGWAKDVDGNVPTGERGSQDYHDPAEWAPGAEPRSLPGLVKPK